MLGRERSGSRCRPLCCGMDWLEVPEVLGGIQSAAKRLPKEWAHRDAWARSGDSASGVEATAPGRPAAGEAGRAVGQEAHGPSVAARARARDANRSRGERCLGEAWRLRACAGGVSAVCIRPRDWGRPKSG